MTFELRFMTVELHQPPGEPASMRVCGLPSLYYVGQSIRGKLRLRERKSQTFCPTTAHICTLVPDLVTDALMAHHGSC